MPYCFPRSSIKFQGHTGQKIADFDPNWGFPDCNSLNWPLNYTSLMKYIRGALLFFRSSIKFQGHTGWKIDDFNKITRPVAAIISLRFALFYLVINSMIMVFYRYHNYQRYCFGLDYMTMYSFIMFQILSPLKWRSNRCVSSINVYIHECLFQEIKH